MEKILLALVCIMLVADSFCQTTTTALTREDYLKKSKNQKTAALAMIIGGAVTTTVGVAVALGGAVDCAYGNPTCGKDHTLAIVLAISGSAAILGSIPFYIAANKSRKKAMSVAVIIEKTPLS